MKKTLFLTFFSFLFILFLLSTRPASAQLANACYSGSWVQPTCNPATSDPGSCNILPPLFSGAACDQHTGYLRIQDEIDAADQTTWTQVYPGKIMVGNVTGQWVVPDGGVEINGPIISGSFTSAAPPTSGYNAGGDIAALDSIMAGGALRVNGAGNFYGQINAYNRVVVSGSVTTGALLSVTNGAGSGNATTIAVRQSAGDVGNILELITADSNTIGVDYLGYVNATKDFQIRLDSDNNSAGSPFDNHFRINNGANNPVFIIDEVGNATVQNNLTVSGASTVTGALTAGTVTTNSGGVGQGAIRGKFVESVTGNTCSDNQLLVYQTTGSPGWYCVASTNVGTTTAGTLLQVLQAGADASSFASPVNIGASILTYNGAPGTQGNFSIVDNESNVSNGEILGSIGFGDGLSSNQAAIVAYRDASGGLNDYPTRIAFLTTPDGSNTVAERMIINNVGNVGIGTTTPIEKVEINDSTGGTARLRITDLAQNPELQLQYNTTPGGHWSMYNNQADDSLRFWANSADRITVLQSGNVGIGATNPATLLHLYATNPILRVQSSTVGSDYLYRDMPGLDLIANGMNGTNKYTPAIKFMSSDPQFITQNPKMTAGIVGRATEVYGSDTDSGMALDFATTPNNGGSQVTSTVRLTIDQSGYVGVGVTNPTAPLSVESSITSGNINFIKSTAGAGNSPTLLYLQQTSGQVGNFMHADGSSNDFYLDYLGYQNNTSDAQIRIDTDNNGANVFRINNGLNSTIFQVDESGVVTVNKLTVTTIDPVYTIKGEKYATYVSGMTGVKEETTGLVNLVYNKKTGLAEFVLDFDTLEKGSDLWLFAQTIKYTENFDKIVVLLTPSFDGRVWYEKDESAHTITIVGKPINSFAKDYEVSYRLTGPRFDSKQWPNTTDEDTDGLIIE